MIEAEINNEDLAEFVINLRKEDELELVNLLGKNYKEKFIQSCFDKQNEIYFLKTDNNLPLAIGGVLHLDNVGQVWLLATKYFYRNKKDVLKYVFQKIDDFKNRFDILFNFIYKTNFSSLKWLKKCDFSVLDIDGNLDYRVFYFSKGAKFDIRHFTR